MLGLKSASRLKFLAMFRLRRIDGHLDTGWSFLVVLGCFLTQFLVVGIHNIFGLLFIDLLEEFGESVALTGSVLTLLLCKNVLADAECS